MLYFTSSKKKHILHLKPTYSIQYCPQNLFSLVTLLSLSHSHHVMLCCNPSCSSFFLLNKSLGDLSKNHAEINDTEINQLLYSLRHVESAGAHKFTGRKQSNSNKPTAIVLAVYAQIFSGLLFPRGQDCFRKRK
jgi:hypothetical protein